MFEAEQLKRIIIKLALIVAAAAVITQNYSQYDGVSWLLFWIMVALVIALLVVMGLQERKGEDDVHETRQ